VVDTGKNQNERRPVFPDLKFYIQGKEESDGKEAGE
jgi:hypothetical protein